MAAYSVAWVILMSYLLSLAARQRKLERQLEQLTPGEEVRTGATHGR